MLTCDKNPREIEKLWKAKDVNQYCAESTMVQSVVTYNTETLTFKQEQKRHYFCV